MHWKFIHSERYIEIMVDAGDPTFTSPLNDDGDDKISEDELDPEQGWSEGVENGTTETSAQQSISANGNTEATRRSPSPYGWTLDLTKAARRSPSLLNEKHDSTDEPKKSPLPSPGKVKSRPPLHPEKTIPEVKITQPACSSTEKNTGGFPAMLCSSLDYRSTKQLFVLLTVLIAILSSFGYTYLASNSTPDSADSTRPWEAENLKFSDYIEKRYPEQTAEQFRLLSGLIRLAQTSNRKQDSSFVFTVLHNGMHEKADSIAKDMARFVAYKFNQTGVMELFGGKLPRDFTSREYILQLKSELMKKGAMIVYNLEKIPSDQARKFHAICDKFTPFVSNKLVYILVLNSPNLDYDHNLDDLRKVAKSSLEELWRDLPISDLSPLIVRLTDNLIQIKS